MKGLSREQLKEEVLEAGVCPDKVVLVHSSLSSLGYVAGGPETVISALLDAVGPRGTLLFPAFTFHGSMTRFLRGRKSINLREFPSRNGLVTETARLWPGALCSLHPTHRAVGIGARAEKLTGAHHRDESCCGLQSPFALNADMDGQILFIGVNFRSNTSLHVAEEMATPYIFNGERFDIAVTGDDGSKAHVCCKGYCVGVPRNFRRLEALALSEGALRSGQVGKARVLIAEAAALLSLAVDCLKKSPRFFLADAPGTLSSTLHIKDFGGHPQRT